MVIPGRKKKRQTEVDELGLLTPEENVEPRAEAVCFDWSFDMVWSGLIWWGSSAVKMRPKVVVEPGKITNLACYPSSGLASLPECLV